MEFKKIGQDGPIKVKVLRYANFIEDPFLEEYYDIRREHIYENGICRASKPVSNKTSWQIRAFVKRYFK
jgi:glycine cleavage system protein P-like pyridoxal-binding family